MSRVSLLSFPDVCCLLFAVCCWLIFQVSATLDKVQMATEEYFAGIRRTVFSFDEVGDSGVVVLGSINGGTAATMLCVHVHPQRTKSNPITSFFFAQSLSLLKAHICWCRRDA